DGVDAHAADADDDHGLAAAHVSGVGGRAPAGGDAAADQGGLVEGDPVVDLDAAGLAHHRVGGERAEAAHHAEVLAVLGVVAGGEVGDLAAGEQEGAEVAEVLAAAGAGRAA